MEARENRGREAGEQGAEARENNRNRKKCKEVGAKENRAGAGIKGYGKWEA